MWAVALRFTLPVQCAKYHFVCAYICTYLNTKWLTALVVCGACKKTGYKTRSTLMNTAQFLIILLLDPQKGRDKVNMHM